MKYLPTAVALCLLSACATDSLYTAGGAALGGLAGNTFGDGDPLATGLGAAAGALGAEFVKGQANTAKARAQTEGYQLGRSDAVKQQYWIIQNQQRQLAQLRVQPSARTSLIPVTLPGRTNASGVVSLPSTYQLRIQD